MKARKEFDFTGRTVGSVKVLSLKLYHRQRHKEIWNCECLLCGRPCEKNGWQLIYEPESQRCKQCRSTRKQASEYERVAGDNYIPTLEEIRAECSAIQEGWSEREKRERQNETYRNPPVEFAVTRLEF